MNPFIRKTRTLPLFVQYFVLSWCESKVFPVHAVKL